MISIQEDEYSVCEDELINLGREHYKEIEILPYEYNPNLELFRQLDKLGMIFVVTVRDDKDFIVGYTLNTLSDHMVFKDVKQSQCNLLYVADEYRGSTPLRLMQATEDVAKSKGATMHSWDVPARNDFSPILERKGYQKIECIYSKHLGG